MEFLGIVTEKRGTVMEVVSAAGQGTDVKVKVKTITKQMYMYMYLRVLTKKDECEKHLSKI